MTPETPSQPRVLVIDDEPAVLKLVSAFLQRAKYDVVTASSGHEGMMFLEEGEEGPIDCVITDAVMPYMTGYDVVKLIRRNKNLAHLPVVMLTRKRNAEDVKLAIQAGVNDYVVKPVDQQLLLDKVELCLKKNEAQRQVFECAIHGSTGQATLALPTQIMKMSENGFTIHSAIQITPDMPIELRTRIFDEIGIPVPFFRLVKCEPIEPQDGSSRLIFEAFFSFVGVAETDLKKIRSWLQKHEIQKRK